VGTELREYGVKAAQDALKDAGLGWLTSSWSPAATIRNGYPGFIAGAAFAQALGWTGARHSCYGA
jgi:hypothetical protein